MESSLSEEILGSVERSSSSVKFRYSFVGQHVIGPRRSLQTTVALVGSWVCLAAMCSDQAGSIRDRTCRRRPPWPGVEHNLQDSRSRTFSSESAVSLHPMLPLQRAQNQTITYRDFTDYYQMTILRFIYPLLRSSCLPGPPVAANPSLQSHSSSQAPVTSHGRTIRRRRDDDWMKYQCKTTNTTVIGDLGGSSHGGVRCFLVWV